MALSIERIPFIQGGFSKVYFVSNAKGNRLGIAFAEDVVLKAPRYHRDLLLCAAIVKMTGKSIRPERKP